MDFGAKLMMVEIVRTVFVCGVFALAAALVFPTTRNALATWLRRPGTGDIRVDSPLDRVDIAAHLDATNAQIAALRGEVYALRCELANMAALRGGGSPSALPSANPGAGSQVS